MHPVLAFATARPLATSAFLTMVTGSLFTTDNVPTIFGEMGVSMILTSLWTPFMVLTPLMNTRRFFETSKKPAVEEKSE